jgi:hypothetical protein
MGETSVRKSKCGRGAHAKRAIRKGQEVMTSCGHDPTERPMGEKPCK